MLSNAANVNAPSLSAFSYSSSVISPRALQAVNSFPRTSTQISLACPEYQGQSDDQHHPEHPHPTRVPPFHTISVHGTSSGIAVLRIRSPTIPLSFSRRRAAFFMHVHW